MNARLRALLEKKAALVKKADAINDAPAGDGEGDDQELSAEQRTDLDGIVASLKVVNGDIERERALLDEAQTATALEVIDGGGGGPDISGGVPVILQDPKRGFDSFNEFCAILVEEGQSWKSPKSISDERLRLVAAAPSTYGSEGVGVDGGFLVAPEFGRDIFMHSLDQDAILPMTDNEQIGGNSITYPKDETTPWGTNGIRVYWESEAAAATLTKPVLGFTTHRLHKLFGLVPLTSELLEDAPAMGSYVSNALSRSLRWKFNDAFVNGTGAGQPLGILNCAALLSQAKYTAGSPDQAADTFVVQNVAEMFSRMLPGSLANAIWMLNPDVFPQVVTMVLNNQPIWTPIGGLPNSPAGSLLGRPILLSQHCQTLGDKGDVYFVDWKMYRSITKAAGIQTATSMHLYFDADVTAFRATFRVDGQPKIASAVDPANGSNTLSPFVTLAART